MEWTERIGRRVKLRDLHIFMAVVQSGSMARAAERLAVSHPVISKTISDLERTLGADLLDRSAQGVTPTAQGRAFLDCCTSVFDDLRRGVQEVDLLSDPSAGEVRVGATGPLADGLVPATIDRLCGRYPRITILAIAADTPSLCTMLRDRKIDLAISRTWRRIYGEDFATDFLFDEPMFVVTGRHSRWARRRKIEISELLADRWIMPELDNVVGALIRDGFRSSGLPLPIAQVTANSMAVRTRLAATGRFLTMLPGSMLHFCVERRALKILPVRLPMESEAVEIITLKNRKPNALVTLLMDELRSVTKHLRVSESDSKKKRGRTSASTRW
jgi:DNA-binding transcriptional LysR family regulator